MEYRFCILCVAGAIVRGIKNLDNRFFKSCTEILFYKMHYNSKKKQRCKPSGTLFAQTGAYLDGKSDERKKALQNMG